MLKKDRLLFCWKEKIFFHFRGKMDPEKAQKIEETVVDILKNTNLEETTEFKVRVTASERLGIDLSETEYRTLVRSTVEKFLVSTAEADQEKRNFNKEVNEGGDRLICKVKEKPSSLSVWLLRKYGKTKGNLGFYLFIYFN